MGADAKRREARKRRFAASATGLLTNTDVASDKIEPVVDESQAKKGKPVKSTTAVDPEDQAANAIGISDPTTREKSDQRAQRFIVFIGNLPYTATDESIRKHFAKVSPISIRHRTEKAVGKSKGFAFLEFEGYDRMKTCLKLFHGLSFDDGISPSRKLSVELTVGGGGGKSTDRRKKLRAKNQRLTEQRTRRLQEEQKQSQGRKNELHKGIRRGPRKFRILNDKISQSC
ncbi:hypothetical protein ACLMJK_009026 [Lecanora helva]